MNIFMVVLIGVGLAMDAFAVSLGVGTSRLPLSARPVFRLSFHFGFFQGAMTLLGWLVGSTIASYIARIDHWIAFALLAFVGTRMVQSGLKCEEEECMQKDPSRGGTLMMLCVATSLDAMAVGLGMAMLDVNIVSASLIIAGVTIILSLFGLLVGNGLGARFGKKMEILGGLILNGIGLRILIGHLFF